MSGISLAGSKASDEAHGDVISALEIRVRGRVQGVGFRPTVLRVARELELTGEVLNDSDGVLIRVSGSRQDVTTFIDRLEREPPPLARIDHIATKAFAGGLPNDFRIVESLSGDPRTQIAPDAAICSACAEEIVNSCERRFRYPFTNCTHCGPRLTIINRIPYDRANTTMAPFAMCEACVSEYRDSFDRRFHAEAIACHTCGPTATLIRLDDGASTDRNSVEVACGLLAAGEIVAVKGLGGYHLACDATNAETVARLRRLKRRDAKPFALMARDLDIIGAYCIVGDKEKLLLTGPAAPIVLLDANGEKHLPDAIAPGLRTLGFMLPTTPLHFLLLRSMNRPLVMTSGNLSDEPQVIDDEEARERLSAIATYAIIHNREIANRVDDSVTRVMDGRARILRRARGYAPAPIKLPRGFEDAPQLLAMGGQLKATFCLLKDGEAILSQHQGDLEEAATFDDYRKHLDLYTNLFNHMPVALVADQHPEYLSTKLAREQAHAYTLPLIEVQHHHAHVAACLAENGYPLNAPPVLGIVLDGLGWGADGTIWGGEFLLSDYRHFERLGAFRPVPMPGGEQAIREPWRNLYAHLMATMSWPELSARYADLELHTNLSNKPLTALDAMMQHNVNSPLASSCGRLFDAVAAALNICFEHQAYEGEAAARLESFVDRDAFAVEDERHAYPLVISRGSESGLLYIDAAEMFRTFLHDLSQKIPASTVAARFHKGLAVAIVAMTSKLARSDHSDKKRFDTVALSGGCFQNRVLFEEVVRLLDRETFKVFSHADVPANDGGLSLGQAAIGAAHLINARTGLNSQKGVACPSRTL